MSQGAADWCGDGGQASSLCRRHFWGPQSGVASPPSDGSSLDNRYKLLRSDNSQEENKNKHTQKKQKIKQRPIMSNSHSSHCFYYTKNVTFNSPETNYEEGIAINAIMCERMSFMCKWML